MQQGQKLISKYDAFNSCWCLLQLALSTGQHFRAYDQDALEAGKILGLAANFHFRLSPSDTLIQFISFLLLYMCIPQLLAAIVWCGSIVVFQLSLHCDYQLLVHRI